MFPNRGITGNSARRLYKKTRDGPQGHLLHSRRASLGEWTHLEARHLLKPGPSSPKHQHRTSDGVVEAVTCPVCAEVACPVEQAQTVIRHIPCAGCQRLNDGPELHEGPRFHEAGGVDVCGACIPARMSLHP